MRNPMLGLGALILAAAAAAPAMADTLKEVTTHGIILVLGDMEIPVTYTPDGKLSAMDGQITGVWRIEGDKLCTSSTADPVDRCIAYPKDKKSGDTFELETEGGAVTIKIR